MSNNVLNKDAMKSIAEIEAQMPHVLDHLARISNEQVGVRATVADIAQNQIKIDGRLNSIEKTIEEIPSKCPHREAIARSEQAVKDLEKLSDRVTGIQEDVAGLQTADRIWGGINAGFATVVSYIMNQLGSNTP